MGERSTDGFTGGRVREFTHAGARISYPLPSLLFQTLPTLDQSVRPATKSDISPILVAYSKDASEPQSVSPGGLHFYNYAATATAQRARCGQVVPAAKHS